MALLERDEQLRAAQGYLADAAAGHGRLVFVAGEPGIGKTTFLEHLLATSDATPLVGWCDGSATPPPLGPLVDMLPQLPATTWPEGASRSEVFAGLLSVLRDPPAGTPYLVVVEDAHWADEATLDLIRHLARRIHACRALVMVSYRVEDTTVGDRLRVLLGDTASATGTRRIDLAPLTAAGVARLAAEQGAAASADLYDVTGGNPFFVTEALSAGTSDLPATVRDAVLARVSRLSETGQRALEVVALAGSRAEADLVGHLLNVGLPALDEPLERGLLRQSGGDLLFRHELARLVVAEQVPAGRRLHLHRRLLAALTERDADPARLAHHAEEAGEDAAMLTHARRAGARAAALGSHLEATRQYERAVRHADDLTAEDRAQLYWDLGYEYYLTSQIDQSIEMVGRARDLWESLGATVRVGDAWRCQSRLHWFAGHHDAAQELADVAVALLDGTRSVEQAMALSHRAGLSMLATRLADTRRWGERAMTALESIPEAADGDEVRVHALNNLGTIEITAGDLEAGRRMLVESLERAQRAELHEHAARAYCNLASSAVVQRRHQEAFHYLDEGIGYCDDRDLDSWGTYLMGWRARLHLDRGDERASRADAAAVMVRGINAVGTLEPLLVVAQLDIRTGAGSGSAELARAVQLAEGMKEAQRVAPTASARCEAAWIAGKPRVAEEIATEAWPALADVDCPWNRGQVATWLPPAVEVSPPLATPYLRERQGRWAEAAEFWAGVESPFDRGLALARSGEVRLMTDAVRIFDGLGASAAATRTRALLRAEGAPVPRASRSTTHADGLTAREAEVQTLVSRGLTDAEIADALVISRRTAEHHVSSILAKRGVNSRRDLLEMGSADAESG